MKKSVFLILCSLVLAIPASARSLRWQESFDLYTPEALNQPNSRCDSGTRLDINYRTRTATLSKFFRGPRCPRVMLPRPRTYQLQSRIVDSCGSRVFQGVATDQLDREDTLRITDNRTRTCEDVRPT